MSSSFENETTLAKSLNQGPKIHLFHTSFSQLLPTTDHEQAWQFLFRLSANSVHECPQTSRTSYGFVVMRLLPKLDRSQRNPSITYTASFRTEGGPPKALVCTETRCSKPPTYDINPLHKAKSSYVGDSLYIYR